MGSSPEDLAADVADVLRRLHAVGYCFDLSPSGDHSGGLFDQILRVFMEDVDQRKIILPFPALIGDGTAVDLFKLYRVVAERGGYGAVSGDQSWGAVAAELGLAPNLAPAVRAMHFKYLGGLNPLLKRVLGEVESGWRESLSSSVCESSTPAERKGSGCGGFSAPEDVLKSHGGSSSSGVTILDPAVGGEAFSSLKRKREARSEMLEWVLGAARCQSDPSVGWMLASSNDDQVLGDDAAVLMSQALMARKMMFSKPILWAKDDGSSFEKRQKAHPGLYEDTRRSNRNHSPSKNSAAAGGRRGNRRSLRKSSALPDAVSRLQSKDPQKRIPVGPFFQAEIPEWTAKPVAYGDSDDQKWLGTEIWSSERGRRTPIGRGRDVACACESPGSVDCVRIHVADKRRQLKRELGSAFVDMGFNDMGEEVALTWTEEEERRFKTLVRLYPPSHRKNFWNQRGFSFPSKGCRGMVSYYFNVFLLRRRRYQNRATPDSIDSDNEERDHDFLSRPFSLDALKAPVIDDDVGAARGAMTTVNRSKPNGLTDNSRKSPNVDDDDDAARDVMTTLNQGKPKPNGLSDNPRKALNDDAARDVMTTLNQSKPKPNGLSDNPRKAPNDDAARDVMTTLNQSKPKPNGLSDNLRKALNVDDDAPSVDVDAARGVMTTLNQSNPNGLSDNSRKASNVDNDDAAHDAMTTLNQSKSNELSDNPRKASNVVVVDLISDEDSS